MDLIYDAINEIISWVENEAFFENLVIFFNLNIR
jgi:hypothetical protein